MMSFEYLVGINIGSNIPKITTESEALQCDSNLHCMQE